MSLNQKIDPFPMVLLLLVVSAIWGQPDAAMAQSSQLISDTQLAKEIDQVVDKTLAKLKRQLNSNDLNKTDPTILGTIRELDQIVQQRERIDQRDKRIASLEERLVLKLAQEILAQRKKNAKPVLTAKPLSQPVSTRSPTPIEPASKVLNPVEFRSEKSIYLRFECGCLGQVYTPENGTWVLKHFHKSGRITLRALPIYNSPPVDARAIVEWKERAFTLWHSRSAGYLITGPSRP